MTAEQYYNMYRSQVPASNIPLLQELESDIMKYAKWLEQETINRERELKEGLLSQEDFDKMIAKYDESFSSLVNFVTTKMTEIANARTPGQKLKLKVKTLIDDVKGQIALRKQIKRVNKILKSSASLLDGNTSDM